MAYVLFRSTHDPACGKFWNLKRKEMDENNNQESLRNTADS
jgi:hypothetical protein